MTRVGRFIYFHHARDPAGTGEPAINALLPHPSVTENMIYATGVDKLSAAA